ncbi:putative eukaryotic translation initiation factor eIF-4A subunit [Kalaharituber pfeilii]|nr:putative eukaryotic translation initiation factor eIF-4A subunit [Kalaharituber pfeilii]
MPDRFGKKADEKMEFTTSKEDTVAQNFDSMHLKENPLCGIYAYGYESTSTVQSHAIIQICTGCDTIAQAPSKAGKTAAFSMPILQVIDTSVHETQAFVLSPTREIATKNPERGHVAWGLHEHVMPCLCGGTNIGPHVVSGTPGRVADMIRRTTLRTKKIKMLVLNEADELLNRGFRESVYDVYRYLPPSTQGVVVGTTLPNDALEMTTKFVADQVRILVKRPEQYIIMVEKEEWTFAILFAICTILWPSHRPSFFCNTRRNVDWLIENLREAGFTVSSMHDGTPEEKRRSNLQNFRQGNSRILISTDPWMRGIDVQQVSFVINYDLPVNRENHIHRIGRSGRFEDVMILRDIEQCYGAQLDEMPMNLGDLLD